MLRERRRSLALALLAVAILAGLGGYLTRAEDPGEVLRLGYFPTLAHAQALAGLETGRLQEALGDAPRLEPRMFIAGPSAVEALFAGRVDVAYLGPGPAINGHVVSRGAALRLVAGAASGGAALVASAAGGVEGVADLAGKRVASPQTGNTQDIALRHALATHGLRTRDDGGTVDLLAVPNPDILLLFQKGELDAAWVPEPWASRLVHEAGGRVVLEERSLWPGGRFATAGVVVRADLLRDRPEVVERFLGAHVDVTRWLQEDPAGGRAAAGARLAAIVGKPLPPVVLAEAWARIEPTWDPLLATYAATAARAHALGFLRGEPDLAGLHDPAPLARALAARGLAAAHPPEAP